MTKTFTTIIVGLLLVSLVGCSLGRFPISEVPVTPALSLKDSEACERSRSRQRLNVRSSCPAGW